ncbi:MAG: FxsA family protein [Granulosicoccus sp.]
MPYALFLFIAMPIVEIALLLRVGDAVGWLPTLLIVVVTAIVGSGMLRQQGLATLNKARQRMDAGEMPAQQLFEGILIMMGGVLLLTPGFVTDTFGFACLIPVTRRWIAAKLSARAIVGFSAASQTSARGASPGRGFSGFGKPPGQSRRAGSGDIIDGDFKRIDDD